MASPEAGVQEQAGTGRVVGTQERGVWRGELWERSPGLQWQVAIEQFVVYFCGIIKC